MFSTLETSNSVLCERKLFKWQFKVLFIYFNDVSEMATSMENMTAGRGSVAHKPFIKSLMTPEMAGVLIWVPYIERENH